MAYKRPEIYIHYQDVEERYIREVEAGIEEEGLFSHCFKKVIADPIASAYEAANASQLGVGICLLGEEVILHMGDLQEASPLIHIQTSDQVVLRKIGSHAARYIKGIPFKEMNEM